ncbi:MAG: hypothetical protein HUU20_21535 [Pirellulales bacterium]|nr:hypothetical protein [Pirellulales bacterium]
MLPPSAEEATSMVNVNGVNKIRRQTAWIACIGAAWLCSSTGLAAADEQQTFLKNPGFEAVTLLKAPPDATAQGKWTLKGELKAPAEWTLSQAFPGGLEVVEGGAGQGQRFVRIAAGPSRAAHLAQTCSGLRPGLGYEVSFRYRGGPVELRVYEYDRAGKLVADRAFARALPTPVRDGAWETLSGVYMVPNGISRVTLALAVPAGGEADLDGVEIGGFERSAEPLNVRDFGASGSQFETLADTSAGSPVIRLQEIGDFRAGHQVAVSRCNPHIADGCVWGREPGKGERDFAEQVQARGYDGTLGNWTAYVLDFSGANPPTFRCSDDLGLTWKEPVRVTGDWQALSGGVEVKLANPAFWTTPAVVSFSGRDQLVSTIVKIENGQATLADPAPIEAKGCLVRHTDSGPLQRALDRAVGEGRNVFIPAGWYRLTIGLNLNGADGIRVEGENEERTVLDISNGQGSCISVIGGTSVAVRNLRFRGFSGFAQRNQMGHMRVHGYPHMWGFYVKHCNAIGIQSPERLLVENCHATGMSAECFYSGSSSRSGNNEPPRYTKSIEYRNCTVADCARNAFNNNDFAENTAVLYCRIQDVGGCSWEGASRFVKIVGNYIRNAGTVAMGNIRSRDASLDILPSGQHIVAHNTFEQQMVYGGCAVRSSGGSMPVIISNNVFVNFNTSAIEAAGFGDDRNLPAGNTIITGNAIDLTCVRDDSRPRFGISVSGDDATVSDNQIYVRGAADPQVQGIVLAEPARNIVVHDNIVRGCSVGLLGMRTEGKIAEVINPRTFRSSGPLPWPRRGTHCYRGCRIVLVPGGNAACVPGPEIETFDPEEGVFRLAGDCDLESGAVFALLAPQGLAWNIHHNVIQNCVRPASFDVFGGPTAVFAGNLLARGETGNVKAAVEVRGLFRITGNQFAGFDEPGSAALLLHPDPLGRPARPDGRDNVFDRCATPIQDKTPSP